jgi:hypothetical protein
MGKPNESEEQGPMGERDFTRIGASMREIGEALVGKLGIGINAGIRTRSTSPTRHPKFVDGFLRYYGPTMNAFEVAE